MREGVAPHDVAAVRQCLERHERKTVMGYRAPIHRRSLVEILHVLVLNASKNPQVSRGIGNLPFHQAKQFEGNLGETPRRLQDTLKSIQSTQVIGTYSQGSPKACISCASHGAPAQWIWLAIHGCRIPMARCLWACKTSLPHQNKITFFLLNVRAARKTLPMEIRAPQTKSRSLHCKSRTSAKREPAEVTG